MYIIIRGGCTAQCSRNKQEAGQDHIPLSACQVVLQPAQIPLYSAHIPLSPTYTPHQETFSPMKFHRFTPAAESLKKNRLW